MDIAFDACYCPVCTREILPKRIQVPVAPPTPPSPAPPPSSPTQPTKSDAPSTRLARGKNGTIRARAGGLVHGTGRVKPNGTIKRSPTKDQQSQPKKASEQSKPSAPVRYRTVIDQGPTPLYCSDECRLADLQSSFHSSPDDSSGSDTNPAPLLSAPRPSHNKAKIIPPSNGVLNTSRAYMLFAQCFDDVPPCPPPPPLLRSDTNSSNDSVPNDYQSGVMMAARRIEAALCPEKPKRSSFDPPADPEYNSSKVIPGWTDGSSAWRTSVYNMAAPPRDYTNKTALEDQRTAYKTTVAFSHRSRGVYSTVTDTSIPSPSSTTSLPATSTRSTSEIDLVNKFSETFARRSESRISMTTHRPLSTSPSGSSRSYPSVSGSNHRREVSILKPGAEGKLLVPNVKMRRTSSTASSLDGTSTSGSFKRVRSPLSRQNSDYSQAVEEEDVSHFVSTSAKKGVKQDSGRSWSYSDLATYPILQLPPKKEIKYEKQIIDGKEMVVPVEVDAPTHRKRLFLFNPKCTTPPVPQGTF
ncbi:hypothetical protein NLI96_g1741 [Meripilus lineatus]|uniref:Uncharacterized protein n=1 Tax=Meripilus lineatus TaxID=2056292 RepID=A0AAD5YI30_9APHY|nr:hypothetical protein NLI96_g1741 [Physisporinus lineatus]